MSDRAERDNPYTSGLAAWIAGLRYDDVPEAVRQRLKLLMLDALGCAVYGAALPWSGILVETITELDTGGGVAIWGTDKRVSTRRATSPAC